MKVKRIIPISLDKKQTQIYAIAAAEKQLHQKAVKAAYLGGGSFGKAFDLTFTDGRHVIVKLLRAKNMLAKEVGDLTLLGAHSTFKMPKVFFVREADDVIPVDCYGMEKIPGKPAMLALGMLIMRKKKRLAFAEKVADAAHAFHECRGELFGDAAAP